MICNSYNDEVIDRFLDIHEFSISSVISYHCPVGLKRKYIN